MHIYAKNKFSNFFSDTFLLIFVRDIIIFRLVYFGLKLRHIFTNFADNYNIIKSILPHIMIFRKYCVAAIAVATVSVCFGAEPVEVPVFITIGQSNADGSAYFDPEEDALMLEWYTSDANTGNMKIWYRSSEVLNTVNSLGEAARHVVDGKVADVEPGWLGLWYRNENTSGRTAMNMIHGYGTYSTGTGTDCSQGRRGMEGEFGKRWATEYPDKELYVLKLGASGSFVSSWADSRDDNNWDYFYRNIYTPAVLDLLNRGKQPKLAGVWWMQGCADRDRSVKYYRAHLDTLLHRVRHDLGFDDAMVYVGHIVAPGENPDYPGCSVQYGKGVRAAQDAFAGDNPGNVSVIDTDTFPFQDDWLHFDHKGQNMIGDALADRVINAGEDKWATFSVPGEWTVKEGEPVFVPALGNPGVKYEHDRDRVTAILDYNGYEYRVARKDR